MPSGRLSEKIVIAGASSLLGAELKALLEESRFASADFRLLDEDIAAGTLTEAGGEAALIQTVDDASFHRAKFVFFSGSPDFTKANRTAALRDAERVFDLSGASIEAPHPEGAVAWFPKLDTLLGREFPKHAKLFAITSAAATATAALTLVLSKLGLKRLAVVQFQPVSEAGRAGIEELESQTGQLLSFQGVGQPVFDAQVAFNLLDRFGAASAQKLTAVAERIRCEVRSCIGAQRAVPAIHVLHAPVFYGSAFTAFAELDASVQRDWMVQACRDAGFVLTEEGQPGPSNVSAAGEKAILLANPEADPAIAGAWWFWGAADNIRLPAANAVKLAEMLA
jgi:aspartate-semialdehyde dehydrogenase